MTVLATTLSLVMLFLAAAHAWWAVGGIWPAPNAAALARGVIGDGRTRMPPPIQCAAVALALAIVGLWPFLMVTHRDNEFVFIGALIFGAIFFIRGSAGYSPRWRGRFSAQPFRTLDHYIYSPLCLALGVGFIALLTREMH
jgi:hypothetical protein